MSKLSQSEPGKTVTIERMMNDKLATRLASYGMALGTKVRIELNNKLLGMMKFSATIGYYTTISFMIRQSEADNILVK